MSKFLFALSLVLHGAFGLALQHYFPDKLVGLFAHKKAASVHQLFPPSVFPPNPSGPGGYWFGILEFLAGFLILKSLSRL